MEEQIGKLGVLFGKNFITTRLFSLFRAKNKNAYLLLILLIDKSRILGGPYFSIPMNFIIENINVDSRTIMSSLEVLKSKNILEYSDEAYISKKNIVKTNNYYKKNLNYIDKLEKLVLRENKRKDTNLETIVWKFNELYRIYSKSQISNQEYIKDLITKLSTKTSTVILTDLKIEKEYINSQQEEFSSSIKGNVRGKVLIIEFSQDFFDKLKNLYIPFNYTSDEPLAAPIIFVFRKLPKNEMIVFLFLMEFYDYLLKDYHILNSPYYRPEKTPQFSLVGENMIIDKKLIAEGLNYDISYINKTLRTLETDKHLIRTSPTETTDFIKVEFNSDKFNEEFDKAEDELAYLSAHKLTIRLKSKNYIPPTILPKISPSY